MPGLYPKIKPYATHHIKVDEPHEIYVEECGVPDGTPVLFIHGGPGSGLMPYHRTFFDPEQYRIILFDQRGCGQSHPHAELQANTTQDLIKDMESIRKHLGVSRWMLFGGSWGATLGLLYAEHYPENVLAMILRGVFLCRPHEIDWFYKGPLSRFYPDHWQEFVAHIPQSERGHILEAYYKRLTGANELARMAAAKAWSKWEAVTSTLQPCNSVLSNFTEPHNALSLARIGCHYFVNHGFIGANEILDNINKIKDIPGIIVQGRYDMICPMESAWDLNQAWPSSELHIVPDAGHASTERGTIDALVRATRIFREQFSEGA